MSENVNKTKEEIEEELLDNLAHALVCIGKRLTLTDKKTEPAPSDENNYTKKDK